MKKVIFDTDLGGDCDDVTALDLIMSADRTGDCELIGVTYSDIDRKGPACIYAVLKEYGYEKIPVGRLTTEKTVERKYAGPVADKFASFEGAPAYENTPDATELLKKLLRENDNVTMIVTGMLSNLANLLKDEEGRELIDKKVDEIDIMACNFWLQNCINPVPGFIDENGSPRPVCEWNVYCDIPAARFVFDTCPVKIVVSPFELGNGLLSGGKMRDHGGTDKADSYSFIVFGAEGKGRDSWDPCTALYGIYGASPWFYKTNPGRVTIDGEGVSHFSTLGGGPHSIIEAALTKEEIGDEIDRLIARLYE